MNEHRFALRRRRDEVAPHELTIGQVAAASGVTAKMIRHYESIDLLPRAERSEAGYRLYHERDVHTLRFIRRARDLGFTLEDIAALLALWFDPKRDGGEVQRVAQARAVALDDKIEELRALQRSLFDLAARAANDARPAFPVLDEAPRERN